MNDNTRYGIWLIAGGFLAYNGISLVRDVMREKPDNYMLFAAVGVVFVVLGVFFVVTALRNSLKTRKKEMTDQDGNEAPEELETIEQENREDGE